MSAARAPDEVAIFHPDDTLARLTFVVHGDPVPQGSKRHVGKGILIEASTRLKPWRNQIADHLRSFGLAAMTATVAVEATFYLRRPKSHYGTGRNAGLLKPTAPEYVGLRPDLDKLARALLDALVLADLIRDDGQVAVLIAEKRYADSPGVKVTVRSLP